MRIFKTQSAVPDHSRRLRSPVVVFAMLIIAAIVFCLFNAQPILSAAKSVRTEPGRTVALAVAEPLADVSSFLLLDRPREFADDLSGRHSIEEIIVPVEETRASTTPTSGDTATSLSFVAELTGTAQVPPVDTAASGRLTLTLAADGESMDFVLEVTGITAPRSADMHQGAAGEIGPIVATVYSGPVVMGTFSGTLASGVVGPGDLTGPLEAGSISDLATLIRSGEIYVVVETVENPGGQIRGSLVE
ncbi:MAG: CHRD domain-containing protein [Thermoleophilia bacterium]|nr:CHRD domain-containing protein [Thermoleophilia bacterium]